MIADLLVETREPTCCRNNVVVKLRKKIEDNASQPRHIVTIYGTGCKLVL